MFDDDVLEHTFVGELAASWPWRGWTFFTRLRLGGVFNRLALEPATTYGGAQIYRPQAGVNAFVYAWTLGFTWRTGWRRSQAAGGGQEPADGAPMDRKPAVPGPEAEGEMEEAEPAEAP
jgi:hypothetical protein